MNPYLAAGIFGAYFVIHALYAKIVLYICDREASKAATASATTSLIMTLGIIHCFENKWYLVPLFMGAWLGTFVATKTRLKDFKHG